VTNDAKAAAIGEMVFGNAKGMKNFIIITLGTGLGSGFVCAGQLINGHHGIAGELGHTTVNPNGRHCNCGKRGCLETYASATGIKRTVYKLLADHLEPSELRGIIKLSDTVVHTDPEAIFLFGGLAQAGDLIFKPTIFHMEQNLMPVFRGRVKVLPSGLENQVAPILGASSLVWDFLERGNKRP
jgi:glucokinase